MISGPKQPSNQRRWILAMGFLIFGSLLFVPLVSIDAWATTIYSYVDEQGSPVMTDNFNTIPERYRAKVKTTEQIPSSPQASTAVTIHERVTSWGTQLRQVASSAAPKISGLSHEQSEILIYAGAAAIILAFTMYMSRGQSVRLLALWCLVMLGLGTPVLMYLSKDGPMDTMKNKAAQVEKQHQDRVQQIP